MLFWIPVVFNSFKATLTTTSQLIRHQSASLTRPTEQFEFSRCTNEVWLTSAGFAFQSCHKLFCPAVRCEALSTDLRSLMRLASGQPRQRCGLHLGWKLEPPEPNCISYSGHGGAAVAGLSSIDPNALFNSSEVLMNRAGDQFQKTNETLVHRIKMLCKCYSKGKDLMSNTLLLSNFYSGYYFCHLGLSENTSHFKDSLQLN